MNTMDTTTIPPRILTALLHVQSLHPEVDRVVFWADGRWAYMTDGHEVVKFDGRVDVGILEDAHHDLPGEALPLAYQLPENN